MNLYTILNLISIFIAFFVGVYVYAKNPGRAINRVFLAYSLAVVLTSFSTYALGVTSDSEAILFWSFLVNLWPVILASQLHLIIIYILPRERIRRFWLYLIWLTLPLVIKASIVETYRLEVPWMSPVNMTLTINLIKTLYSFITSAVILVLGIGYLIRTSDILNRIRMGLLLTGIMMPTIYGMIFFGPLREVLNSSGKWYIIVIFSGWTLILIAIRQYRLFDITPVFAADAIIARMKEALLLIDRNGRIRVANNAFYSITGFSESAIVGQDINVFFRNCEFPETDIPALYADNELVNKQFGFKPATGNTIPMIFTNSFLRKRNGQIIGHVFVFTDIKELTDAQEQLRVKHLEMLRLARQAGMAEVANDVMHNIGNVLTSVNVSTEKIDEILLSSRIKGLSDANRLLSENSGSLTDFINNDNRGQVLIDYYHKLEQCLRNEHKILIEENRLLARKLNLIKTTVEMQQANVREDYFEDYVDIQEVLDEVLIIMEEMTSKNNIEIVKKVGNKEMITVVPRSKLFNIILNLVKNAAESVIANDPGDRLIEITLGGDDESIIINVSDNGCGISPEDMQKLFTYGFTTKKGGHGFGLHFCATAINELKGSIVPHSAGKGLGAEFVVTIPRTATIIN